MATSMTTIIVMVAIFGYGGGAIITEEEERETELMEGERVPRKGEERER